VLVASNKYDGDTFSNVRDKKNGCGEIGFVIVCLYYTLLKSTWVVNATRTGNKFLQVWRKCRPTGECEITMKEF